MNLAVSESAEHPVEPRCLSCGFVFEKMPTRRRKCPGCREPVYVKRAPWETVKRIVSTEEATEIEALWEARESEARFVRLLQGVGISEDQFTEMREILRPFTEAATLDWQTTWVLCNERLAGESGLHSRQMLFFKLAQLTYEMNLPDFRNYLRAAHAACIENCRSDTGFTVGVKILGNDNPTSCDACRAHNGAIYSLDEAAASEPLPCKGCTCEWWRGAQKGFCRCMYSPIFNYEWDELRHTDERARQPREQMQAIASAAPAGTLPADFGDAPPDDDEDPRWMRVLRWIIAVPVAAVVLLMIALTFVG